jgi:hypothetical protein
MAPAASARAFAVSLETGNHWSGSIKQRAHRALAYTSAASLLSLSSPSARETG